MRLSLRDWQPGMESCQVIRPTTGPKAEIPGSKCADGLVLAVRARPRERARDRLDLEALDDVADLHVVEVHDADAALEAFADLAGVVLEALERRDLSGVDDRPVADQPHLRLPIDGALGDVAPGDGAHARDAEDLAHLGRAHHALLDLGSEQAL